MSLFSQTSFTVRPEGVVEKFPAGRRYTALTVIVAIIPFFILAVFALHESQEENRRDIEAALELMARRVTEILTNVEQVLRQTAKVSGGECDAQTVRLLAAHTYTYAAIRELGIVRDFRLECTSWGTLKPPIALRNAHESLPDGEIALYALDKPATGFRANSLVIGLGLGGADQINALIYPQAIYRVLDGFAISDINIGLVLDSKRLLAARDEGSYFEFPEESAIEAHFPQDGYLRRVRAISGFPLSIVAELPARLQYQHLLPQFTLYLCGAFSMSLAGIWLIRRLTAYFRSIPFQLHTALTEKQLQVLYQPVVDMQDHHCVGMEALLRWDHPLHGMLKPDLFVPMAERTSVILPLTGWVINQVIADLEDLLARRSALYVSVNLCRKHLENGAFIEQVTQRLRRSKIKPEQVHFELTERTTVADDAAAIRAVANLRDQGFRVTIDDFGTGYSTLSSLKAISADYLKIDKTFIEAIGTCAVTSHLVDSIIEMAQKLKLETIAEGVENEAQVAYLVARGITLGQGFFFSGPLRTDRLVASIQAER